MTDKPSITEPSRRLFLAAGAAGAVFGALGAAIAQEAGRPELTAEEREELLDAYDEWLYFERKLLHIERFGMNAAKTSVRWTKNTPATHFHFPKEGMWNEQPQPSTRAALVLSAIGCPWQDEA